MGTKSIARGLAALALTAAAAGAAQAQPAPDADDTVDIKPVANKLDVVTDGKGHYMVVETFKVGSDHLYYGDGKDFWRQRAFSGSADMGQKSFDRTFWSPQVEHHASIDLRKGAWKVTCGKRVTPMTPLPKEEAAKMLASAHFHGPLWKRQAYALARDSRGRYYYVDRFREEYGTKGFRLYVGPKGNLKLQKMTNVVNDSKGDIFSTRTGELRLILSKGESSWIRHKHKTGLVNVPVEDNIYLVYVELGVYAGQRLGTPCDDL